MTYLEWLALLQERLAFKREGFAETKVELQSLKRRQEQSFEVIAIADRELQERKLLLDRVPEVAKVEVEQRKAALSRQAEFLIQPEPDFDPLSLQHPT